MRIKEEDTVKGREIVKGQPITTTPLSGEINCEDIPPHTVFMF